MDNLKLTKKVYCFGNEFIEKDSAALKLADDLKGILKNTNEFDIIKCDSPEQMEGKHPLIIDVVENLKEPMMFDIEKLHENNMVSLHDFDLGFNLLLMKEMGIIENADIIGIPADFHVQHMDKVIDFLKRVE